MYCGNCGQNNPDYSTSCSACGMGLAAGMGMPSPPRGTPPPNHLVWAILTTLFCCLPGGIVAIVYAAQVDSKFAAGDLAGAHQSSDNAKLWSMISAGVALAGLLGYLGLIMIAAMSGSL